MGCDITILSRHKLNITNIETLAIDLSKRLDLTIEYGYYANKECNELLNSDLEDGFVSLGLINSKQLSGKHRLIDEKFQQKELYEIYENGLFERKEYWNCFGFTRMDAENLTQNEIK
jgi:uncharacterized protein YqgQ